MVDSAAQVDLEKIVSLCKRRGFVFQSSEIYGGLSSSWDFGPLGVEMVRNLKDSWWRTMVWSRNDMVGLDAAVLMHPDAWRASGHVDSFSDPLVECRDCHRRYREDHLDGPRCPTCNGELSEPRQFNMMFKTFMGPVEEQASEVYLRPETAQGIFVNFNNVVTATRKRLPFGIAQIGKAFRNEITTGNFIFRNREFEMLEIEYFVKPGDDEKVHQQWMDDCIAWYTDLGIERDRLRLRPHEDDELSHYAKATYDIEYRYPWGWGEIMGIANRTDFDLKAHSDASGQALSYFDPESNEHIVPYVIEPSAGIGRAVMTFLIDAYTEEEAPTAAGKTETRVLLKLHPTLAPVKVAVLPLSRNEKLAPLAQRVFETVQQSGRINGYVQFDDTQSIGRRYRRQDEVGTPLCVTVDFDSLDDDAVTIRDRDTMDQDRVSIDSLVDELTQRLEQAR
ncbi:MAG: glycine--tRNA ligase [SAR202 cluster bacterium]|jgi:glycyl-tRNA synthetase|nr:glycine--tRNA ligase [Chloroflexota bacterium]MDP6421405.1 glycine--tRNA ligase [SAR202 cluster bacterium]HAL48748.1 glycine--tRNA ligase [Dehalococcoidia bacterium]MDP6664844.1 glycine--tRNA ligase [SAR202 cluster bacterium]MDP6801270.1 glycine--tRNA ligase [SAR202 cluster bacterium]|tara:strand:- start:1593 stop:2939 length:1347 start_codon:yes stop_codon:yes gene_type:complete